MSVVEEGTFEKKRQCRGGRSCALRSYSVALSIRVNNGDVRNAPSNNSREAAFLKDADRDNEHSRRPTRSSRLVRCQPRLEPLSSHPSSQLSSLFLDICSPGFGWRYSNHYVSLSSRDGQYLRAVLFTSTQRKKNPLSNTAVLIVFLNYRCRQFVLHHQFLRGCRSLE